MTFEVTTQELKTIESKMAFRWCRKRSGPPKRRTGQTGCGVTLDMPVVFYCPEINSLRCYKVSGYRSKPMETIIRLA